MSVPLFSTSMLNQFPTLHDQYGSRVATLDRWDTFRTPGGFDSGLRIGGDRILDSVGCTVGRVNRSGEIRSLGDFSTGLFIK